MKKLLSVILAVMMSVSVFAIAAIPALAVESPTASTATNKGPVLEVNGNVTDTDIKYTPDPNDDSTIKFEYTGDGSIEGWETNLGDLGFEEGVDYIITENPDGTLTITFINDKALEAFNNGEVRINAVVSGAGTTSTTKGNGSNTSPNTGIATSVVAGSVAFAGAGIAVLSATKKRDAE